MRGLRGLILCTLAGVIGFAADVSHAALAKKLGGSGLSGKLSSNKAIRKQQLIADPNEPDSGSDSVLYDPSVVSIGGVNFGPGYTGSTMVEVKGSTGGVFLQDLTSFLSSPAGTETGYAQVSFNTPVTSGPPPSHGQISVARGYSTVDSGGPAGVDTHAFFFNYLTGVPDTTVAVYTLYADPGNRSSDNHADFLAGTDSSGRFVVGASDIGSVTVRGSLVSVPVPPAVWAGGLTLIGVMGVMKLRRQAVA